MHSLNALGWKRAAASLLPGIGLCGLIGAVAVAGQALEKRTLAHPYVEALVLAILIGIAVRTAWVLDARLHSGIAFCAKQLLEVAVLLLGASLSLWAILASGPTLLIGIVGTVVIGIAGSFLICRTLGLPARMAILVACGNAICGNSAIAAVAPVIGARAEDVAAAIAFTAVLGVVMALGLPLFVPLMGMSEHQYGVLAGLTVYAVPQVLAATAPVSFVATQVGTLVKLGAGADARARGGGLLADRSAPAARGQAGRRGRAANGGPARLRQANAVVHSRLPGAGDPALARPDPGRGGGATTAADRRADRAVDGGAGAGRRRARAGARRRSRDAWRDRIALTAARRQPRAHQGPRHHLNCR